MITFEDLKKNSQDCIVVENAVSGLLSPLSIDLDNLPPTLILVGDHEILLSDSIRLAERMAFCYTKVELKVWGVE